MRVLHVIHSLDPDMGGLPKVAAALPAAQAEAGAETALLHYSSPSQESAVESAYGSFPGFSRVRRLALLDPSPAERLFNRQALRLARAFQPDVVHTHGVWEPLLRNTLVQARRDGVRSVVQPHSMLHPWHNRHRRLAKGVLKGPLGWRRAWAGATFWQALTREEHGYLTDQGVNARIEIVPNGLFAKEVHGAPNPEAFAAVLPERKGRPYLLFLARLAAQKAPEVLLEAFARVAPRLPELCLVLAGPDYGLADALRSRAHALGLRDRVFLPGSLRGEAKRAAVAGCLAFCLPSRSEGFSMALLEAAAEGVPLLISPECCFSEMAEAGGAVIAPSEPTLLADALLNLASNPDHAASMGRAARARVLTHYAWPGIATRLLTLYDRKPA